MPADFKSKVLAAQAAAPKKKSGKKKGKYAGCVHRHSRRAPWSPLLHTWGSSGQGLRRAGSAATENHAGTTCRAAGGAPNLPNLVEGAEESPHTEDEDEEPMEEQDADDLD